MIQNMHKSSVRKLPIGRLLLTSGTYPVPPNA